MKDDVKKSSLDRMAKKAVRAMRDSLFDDKSEGTKSQRGRKKEKEEQIPPVFDVLSDKENMTVVPVDKLKIDERYQFHPETEPGRLNRLEQYLSKEGGYSPAKAGAIHVSRRKNDPGYWYVLDGYGRVWMGTRMVHKPITEIAATDHGILDSWEQEAHLFLDLNRHRRAVKTPHLFVVAGNAGHEPEATILQAVLDAGYAVEKLVHKKGAILAPSALIFAHTLLGDQGLKTALFNLRHTWGDNGVSGQHLVQLAAVMAIQPRLDQKRLREIYLKWPAKEALAAARSKAQSDITSRNPQSRDINPYFARETIRRYNQRLEYQMNKRISSEKLESLIERFTSEAQYKDVWNFGI